MVIGFIDSNFCAIQLGTCFLRLRAIPLVQGCTIISTSNHVKSAPNESCKCKIYTISQLPSRLHSSKATGTTLASATLLYLPRAKLTQKQLAHKKNLARPRQHSAPSLAAPSSRRAWSSKRANAHKKLRKTDVTSNEITTRMFALRCRVTAGQNVSHLS